MSFKVDVLSDAYPIADFIAEVLGNLAEVVVHDIKDLESSIVYIRNGHLSGRKVGDGTTDAALKMIKEGLHGNVDYVANYGGKSLAGRRFRCSTYFIKDRSDTLVGLLCVNIDVTGMDGIIRVLQDLHLGADAMARTAWPMEENLQGNPRETISRRVGEVISASGKSAREMLKDDKVAIIQKLNDEGIFLMKGAVNVVADSLLISVPTAYRYLQKVKSGS